ncbi:helix-turn-helix domain-containing protein [Brevibacillus laterosporus]|uniref:Helix-turn-helix transcriptional regulator n=1 Tax=Brevibacillus laterosporus TaxID=1465 RepID=A0AAP3GAM0_BRELA|nr:helix-turn-helix transcriptional regulator [Brevibacillus laterosporus]MCR8982620.1 helix-turn-helix domain-containing protein [Brevibacillus laterosporus]MCZ0809776.1 helix-turn-helix transcriptional regulator [Brevibacillus laterosporus]MCZ0828390.1 helix-turn-helix transcriptional regulator [Brevibacillus laterosporus]MCZ0852400.1 helix-turn-helix transcriptional regulator [Brevibacillus laterosporus]
MKYGAILHACRERAGLSQEQLAEKINRSRSCISKLETDKKTLDFQTVLAWVEATGTKEVAVAFFCGMDGMSIMQNVLHMMGV